MFDISLVTFKSKHVPAQYCLPKAESCTRVDKTLVYKHNPTSIASCLSNIYFKVKCKNAVVVRGHGQ